MNENTEGEKNRLVTPDLVGREILAQYPLKTGQLVVKMTVWRFSPNGKYVQLVCDESDELGSVNWVEPDQIHVVDMFPDRNAAEDARVRKMLLEHHQEEEKSQSFWERLKFHAAWMLIAGAVVVFGRVLILFFK